MESIDFANIDFSTIGESFKVVSQHMKGGFPVFEEFLEKGQRLHRSLDHMLLHLGSFFDSFAKIAEHAVHAKGSTREVGTALTNVAMWHKGLEMRLRDISSTLQHKMLTPLTSSLEEWKKLEYTMERENDKELSKAIKEAKEANKGTVRMEKKLAKKDKLGPKHDSLRQQLTQQQQDKDNKYTTAVAVAKKHLSRALVEERSQYCSFIGMFSNVMRVETGLIKDMQHLMVIQKDLEIVSRNPHRLLEKSLHLVENVGTNRALSPDSLASPEGLSPSQSPPPPPPPPPGLTVSTPSPPTQSPTPSQISGVSLSSMNTPEVVPVENVVEPVENGYTELRRVITTTPLRAHSPPDVNYLSQPNLGQSSNTPTVVRRFAAASRMNSVGVVASPKLERRVPPPVAHKPPKMTHRHRADTTIGTLNESPVVESLDLPRPSSFSGAPIAEEDSPLLKAIKEARLKKAITHDRSTPHVHGEVQDEIH